VADNLDLAFAVQRRQRTGSRVRGERHHVHAEPGDTFGDGSKLTYHKTTTVSGTRCAVVSYDAQSSFTVCPGDMHLAA